MSRRGAGTKRARFDESAGADFARNRFHCYQSNIKGPRLPPIFFKNGRGKKKGPASHCPPTYCHRTELVPFFFFLVKTGAPVLAAIIGTLPSPGFSGPAHTPLAVGFSGSSLKRQPPASAPKAAFKARASPLSSFQIQPADVAARSPPQLHQRGGHGRRKGHICY